MSLSGCRRGELAVAGLQRGYLVGEEISTGAIALRVDGTPLISSEEGGRRLEREGERERELDRRSDMRLLPCNGYRGWNCTILYSRYLEYRNGR